MARLDPGCITRFHNDKTGAGLASRLIHYYCIFTSTMLLRWSDNALALTVDFIHLQNDLLVLITCLDITPTTVKILSDMLFPALYRLPSVCALIG